MSMWRGSLCSCPRPRPAGDSSVGHLFWGERLKDGAKEVELLAVPAVAVAIVSQLLPPRLQIVWGRILIILHCFDSNACCSLAGKKSEKGERREWEAWRERSCDWVAAVCTTLQLVTNACCVDSNNNYRSVTPFSPYCSSIWICLLGFGFAFYTLWPRQMVNKGYTLDNDIYKTCRKIPPTQ